MTDVRDTFVVGDTFTNINNFSFPNGCHTDKRLLYVMLILDR